MSLRKFLMNVLLPFFFLIASFELGISQFSAPVTTVSLTPITVADTTPIAVPPAKEEFKPNGRVFGYAFGDFYYKSGGDTATWASRAEYSGVPKDVNAFALRRMYLGYEYNISLVFSTLVMLEAQDVFQDTRGDRTVTIKSLYLSWKNIYKGTELRIGQIPTLSYALMSESIWFYRSIEKMIIDQRAIRSSSDLGVALIGVLNSAGTYGYNLMVGNGTGTRPEELTPVGKGKIYSAEVFGKFLDKKLMVELYGDVQTGIDEKNQLLLKSLVGYKTEPLTIGVEVMHQTLYHNKSDATNAVPFGFSVFARGSLVKDKLGAFARFDTFNPDLNYRAQDVPSVYNRSTMFQHYDEQFFVAGLDFTPHKKVHLMPNIWINSYSAKGESSILVERKADIVPRVTFLFEYK